MAAISFSAINPELVSGAIRDMLTGSAEPWLKAVLPVAAYGSGSLK